MRKFLFKMNYFLNYSFQNTSTCFAILSGIPCISLPNILQIVQVLLLPSLRDRSSFSQISAGVCPFSTRKSTLYVSLDISWYLTNRSVRSHGILNKIHGKFLASLAKILPWQGYHDHARLCKG